MKMKIAYVDVELSGHHINYLTALFNANPKAIALIPQKLEMLPEHRQFVIPDTNALYKHPFRYLHWLSEIYQIAVRENVDIIHFLYGDAFVRYFGFGLLKFKKYKPIVTFHQIRRHWLKDISLRRLCKRINIGIVHTEKLKSDFRKMGIKNIEQIEYPCFSNYYSEGATKKIRKRFNIKDNVPVLLLIGMVTRYKGLELLVEALTKVTEDYHLIVCGYNQEFSNSEIESFKTKLGNKVTFDLHYLSETEYGEYLSGCDIVMLPYSKRFDGASGPLVDAVSLRKPVIASNHESLGDIVTKHSLGLLFEAENIQSLQLVLQRALSKGIFWNKAAEQYREFIVHIDYFIKANEEIYNKISVIDE